MHALIVDDEPPARARLRRLLAAHADVASIDEAADAEQALHAVAERRPDVAFLDVQMPGVDGLDLAASLPDPAPAVVFVTAHDRYALQAFEAAAVDYLLKPVDPQRLARALERVRARLGGERPAAAPAQLLIPDRGTMHVVRVGDVRSLKAADNYVEVHVPGRVLLMRRTLAALLGDLGEAFVRTHRSAAVAIAHVRSVQARGNGDGLVLLDDDTQVPVSRAYRDALHARLAAR